MMAISDREIEYERGMFALWFERQKTGHKLVETETGYEQSWINFMWCGWIAAKQDAKQNMGVDGV